MSKRRNRNRSAKRDTTNATPTNSFEDRAYTYAQHFRRKIKAMSWDYALSVGMDMDELRIRRKSQLRIVLRMTLYAPWLQPDGMIATRQKISGCI